MLALACGELVMVTAAVLLIREVVDGSMAIDFIRGLAAGAATILLMRALPTVNPLIGIPLCVLMFLAVAVAVRLLKRSDLELLSAMVSKRGPLVAENY